MDGEAVSLAFATTAGPDCLKDVISKYGIRLKVYRTIKEQLEHNQVKMCGFNLPLSTNYFCRKVLMNKITR